MNDDVAIVGGGIGGLTLAAALLQRGVHAQVYEQASKLEEIGAGISLHANSVRLLERLGVAPDVERHASEPPMRIYRRWDDGRQIARHTLGHDGEYRRRFGSPYLAVHRQHLQSALVGALPDDCIHLDHRLESLETDGQRARLFWNAGETSADLVVAADGARSIVRRWMTGRELARYSGTSAFRGIVPIHDLPTLDEPECVQFWMGPQRHVLHFPIGADSDRVTFLAATDGPADWDSESWRVPTSNEEALREYSGWHPAVREMIDAVDHAERWGLFVVDPIDSWVKGNVVLLGDSAHGMLPHYGQGGNQAIEDAVALAAILTETSDLSIGERLTAFESLRKPRTTEVQRYSWEINNVLHLPDGTAAERRDAALPNAYSRSEWMYDYDSEQAAHDAVSALGAARARDRTDSTSG